MKKFFNPKSVAIIGASASKGKIGNILVENLKQKKDLLIYPVNPKAGKIEGLKTFSNVLDIEDDVDLAVVAVPAKFVPDVIRECAWKQQPIKNIIIISAGFSETGKEGAELEKQIQGIAKEYDLRIAGPNCLGFLNANENFNASFAKKDVKGGSVGLIMQSGALTTALIDLAKEEAFGFSLISTVGNKIDIDETALIDFYLKDKATKIIAFYLEDISDGEKFKEAVQKASIVKPVIIIKAGVSQAAQKAIQSHTGSMAKNAEITRLALEESGAIYCESLYEFVACIKFLNSFQLPASDKLTIVTNAGGPGVITTDLTQKDSSIRLTKFTEKQQRDLLKKLPSESSVKNPIDLLGDAMEDRYKDIIDAAVAMHPDACVAVLITPQSQTPIEKIAEKIIEANRKKICQIIPVFMGKESANLAKKILSEGGISNFEFPFEVIVALRKINWYLKKISALKQAPAVFTQNNGRKEKIQQILKRVKAEKRRALFYSEAKKIGDKYDLNTIKASYINSENQISNLSINYPVVLKVDGEKYLHKNAKEALVLNIENKKNLKEYFAKFKKSFGEERFLVQSQQEVGFELIIGMKRDPDFGPVLMIGLGGIFTEIINEKILLMLPKTATQIKNEIKGSKIGKVISKLSLPVEDLVDQASKVAKLAMENEEITELDVNPIFLYKDKKSKIVDIKILI